jgi:hypothetical protein
MASEGLPVTGSVVTWARERAGLSLDQARKDFARIEEWEAGTAFPTYPQVEKMALAFKLPVAAFFFPEPPKLPSIKESFRTLPDTTFDQIPRPVRFLLQKAKAFQLNLAELAQGRNPAPRLITMDLKLSAAITADNLAVRVRDYLGVTLEQQQKWSDDDEALKHWREVLQTWASLFLRMRSGRRASSASASMIRFFRSCTSIIRCRRRGSASRYFMSWGISYSRQAALMKPMRAILTNCPSKRAASRSYAIDSRHSSYCRTRPYERR